MRTEKSITGEAFYDKHIDRLLDELERACNVGGLNLVAMVEWDPVESTPLSDWYEFSQAIVVTGECSQLFDHLVRSLKARPTSGPLEEEPSMTIDGDFWRELDALASKPWTPKPNVGTFTVDTADINEFLTTPGCRS